MTKLSYLIFSTALFSVGAAHSQVVDCDKLKSTNIPYEVSGQISVQQGPKDQQGESQKFRISRQVYRNEGGHSMIYVSSPQVPTGKKLSVRQEYIYGMLLKAVTSSGESTTGTSSIYSPAIETDLLSRFRSFDISFVRRVKTNDIEAEAPASRSYKTISEDYDYLGACRMKRLQYEVITRQSGEGYYTKTSETINYYPEIRFVETLRFDNEVENQGKVFRSIQNTKFDAISTSFTPIPQN